MEKERIILIFEKPSDGICEMFQDDVDERMRVKELYTRARIGAIQFAMDCTDILRKYGF